MKRNFCSLLFVMISLFLLSGCGTPQPEITGKETNYTITIPGLKKEYTFYYLTDAHAIAEDETADDQLSAYIKERSLVFTDEHGVTSLSRLEEFLSYADSRNADGILLGGDLIDSPSSANLSLLENLIGTLKTPYLYTIGNHDWTYPWEYMTDEGRERYLPLLRPYMDGSTAIHSLDFGEFLLVSVDNSSNQIDPSVMDTYRTILSQKKPVILMLHVPLMTDSLLEEAKNSWDNGVVLGGGVNGGIYPNDVSAEFINLTTASDSPVAAILAGHVHFAHQSEVKGGKNIPQLVGGAGFTGEYTRILIK